MLEQTRNKSAEERIPQYSLYGNWADGKEKWFVSVEHLAKRCEERGWVIEPHVHPNFAQLVITLRGAGICSFEERDLNFSGPDAIVVPMHCVHSFHYQEDADGWVITVEKAYLEQINRRLIELSSLWNQPQVIHLPSDPRVIGEIENSIEKLMHELENKELGHFIAVEAQLTSIFLHLLRCRKFAGGTQGAMTNKQVKLVREFQDLIEQNYRLNWKLGKFAEVLNASVAQLRAACENVCGLSPIKMIHDRKMTEAKRNLIFSDMNIEQIAYWLGFSSPAYFTRFFKNELGVTPAEFRRKGRQSVGSH